MHEMRVATAALEAMATRWATTAGELTASQPLTALEMSTQPSAAAVSAAHADVALFTAGLATRVDMRANHVAGANTRYVDGEERSANELSALLEPTMIV
jgi:hypothetical protein